MPVVSIPAPVGGWNARDALAAMEPTDAIDILNWIPAEGYLESREGYTEFADMDGENAHTLAVHRGEGGSSLVAAGPTKIMHVESGSVSDLKTGYSANPPWQTANMNGVVVMVNGTATPQTWDGAAGSTSDLSATGPTIADLIGLNVFKGRMFYWTDDSDSFWYAGAGAHQGTLTEFPMSSVAEGGKLVQMVTWTRDAGDGMDDLAVFIFDTGTTLVYQGSDPGSASDWSLVGRFSIGSPLSIRGHARFGSDEVILTKDGYLNLSAALNQGRVNTQSNVSNKIIRAVKRRVNRLSNSTHWECTLLPAKNLFIVNVPLSDDTLYEQHALNTATGAWTRLDLPARTMANFNDKLYFVQGDIVYQYGGISDNGSAINYQATSAYSHVGDITRKKQLTGIQPVSNYSFPARINVQGGGDYETLDYGTFEYPVESTPSDWDVGEWDDAIWGNTEGRVRSEWITLSGYGYAVAFAMQIQTRAQKLRWYQTNVMYQAAGVI